MPLRPLIFLCLVFCQGVLAVNAGAQTSPIITSQPQGQSVVAGGNATFTVAANGATSYQWLFNGVAISNATNSALTLLNVTTVQAGVYSVYVANNSGSTTSTQANYLGHGLCRCALSLFDPGKQCTDQLWCVWFTSRSDRERRKRTHYR